MGCIFVFRFRVMPNAPLPSSVYQRTCVTLVLIPTIYAFGGRASWRRRGALSWAFVLIGQSTRRQPSSCGCLDEASPAI